MVRFSLLKSSNDRLCERSPCHSNRSQENEGPKTVNIFVIFFFMVNFMLATAFLGMPFAFFHGGLLAVALALLVVAFVNWNTAMWVLETMARAQAILNHSQSEIVDSSKLPKYVLLQTRKFEITELCGMFLGRWTKYAYLILLIGSSFLFSVALSTVAASSWAVNLPLNFADVAECNNSEFRFHTLPVIIPCRNTYWFCLFLFACIVIPLSMIELKEQAIVQVIMSLLRFITIGAILVFCIANLIIFGNICTCKQPWQNYPNATDGGECNIYSSAAQATLHFDLEAWTVAIPLMLPSLCVSLGVPVLTHPVHVRQKKHLGILLHILFIAATTLCMMLGVVVPLWWKDCINETCILSWDPLTDPSYSLALRVLSYFIILFPSVDVISSFALNIITVVNNTFVVIVGKDSAHASESWTSFIVLLLMKFLFSLLSILVAMVMSNLITVFKFMGTVSFLHTYLVPILLQLRSQWVCRKIFQQALELRYDLRKPSSHADSGVQSDTEERPLLIRLASKEKPSALYMTPYSTIFSYWPAVVVIGGVGVVLFVLTVASFFLPPVKVVYSVVDQYHPYILLIPFK